MRLQALLSMSVPVRLISSLRTLMIYCLLDFIDGKDLCENILIDVCTVKPELLTLLS
ncbi:hypothetical protein BC827DRAFT_1198139 [Russula dissimulans]|nr:hypothetical protein BC827DRAFT_1198139 [Russula dissimulans]